VGAAVALLAVVEVQGLVQTVRSQTRLRERVVRTTHDAIVAALPRLAAALAPGGRDAWIRAADEGLRSSLAAEAEVFDASSGSRQLARPAPAPVEHTLSPSELRGVQAGSVLTVGPIVGRSVRLLSYVWLPSGSDAVLLRLSTAVPDLVEDLRERRQLLLGHALALVLLVIAAGLALFPSRTEPSAAPPEALDAYEEAMGRLRDRGEEMTRSHAAERRRMEDEIQDKEAMARAGELTAGIAHEVRNGLATILGYARLLERGASPEETAEAALRIREECETLETVVRRFMDFVKREDLELAAFDLGRLLSRVVARESRSHPGAEVATSDLAAVGTIVGDEELLERAFENLIRNAREAAGPGGHVAIDVARAGGAVAVHIADDGPGFPAGKKPRPFFTTKAGGLGLGLPLALKIVGLHHGAFELADRAPHGLEVTVRLPENGPPAGPPG
jgi:signal transduction histidine kinase